MPDSGGADPLVADTLALYAAGRSGSGAVVAALADSRVLVPVVAVLGETEYNDRGVAHDKTTDIAAVLMTGRDGRAALLAFTCLSSMQAWRPDARPVPVPTPDAAKSAVAEDAAALLVDVAGPVPFVVETEDLEHLAAGHRLVATPAGFAWVSEG